MLNVEVCRKCPNMKTYLMNDDPSWMCRQLLNTSVGNVAHQIFFARRNDDPPEWCPFVLEHTVSEDNPC